MGWVMTSERELNRVEVLAQVDDGRLTVDNASHMLALTRRQVFRLLKRYRQDGASAIRHKARGKPPNNRIHHAKRDYALSLIKESYADFGPTLAAEMLAEHHGFKVSRETIRKWMQEDGMWLKVSRIWSVGPATSTKARRSAPTPMLSSLSRRIPIACQARGKRRCIQGTIHRRAGKKRRAARSTDVARRSGTGRAGGGGLCRADRL